MSAERSDGKDLGKTAPGVAPRLHGVESGTEGLLRVETVFHVADESQGQAVAAKLIDRAHELANSPECECDVDVSVEWVRPGDPVDPGGGSAHGRTAAR